MVFLWVVYTGHRFLRLFFYLFLLRVYAENHAFLHLDKVGVLGV